MNHRLLSLDVLRGLTIVGMIIVNNGVGERCFVPLEHAAWNGLTPTDLVFPFFLFMVGVSIALSLGKYSPAASLPLAKGPAVRKVLVRSVKLFLIGLLLTFSGPLLRGKPIPEILEGLRIWGVLQRIALCYLFAALISLYVRPQHLWRVIAALLIAYTAFLLLGNGYAADETNLACRIDRALVGPSHVYAHSPVDPEGLAGTLSAIAHTLIGVVVGFMLKVQAPLPDRLVRLFGLATALSLGGYLLSYGLPINKTIWSPSYTLLTSGIATALLAWLTVLTDLRGWAAWCRPFQWFGMNAIALFVGSGLLARIFIPLHIPGTLYNAYLSTGMTEEWASLAYALTFLAIMTALAYGLYRKQIFLKL